MGFTFSRFYPVQVIQTLLPQIRRQLRRLIKSPRPRPPEICRNSKQALNRGHGRGNKNPWAKSQVTKRGEKKFSRWGKPGDFLQRKKTKKDHLWESSKDGRTLLVSPDVPCGVRVVLFFSWSTDIRSPSSKLGNWPNDNKKNLTCPFFHRQPKNFKHVASKNDHITHITQHPTSCHSSSGFSLLDALQEELVAWYRFWDSNKQGAAVWRGVRLGVAVLWWYQYFMIYSSSVGIAGIFKSQADSGSSKNGVIWRISMDLSFVFVALSLWSLNYLMVYKPPSIHVFWNCTLTWGR